MTTATHTLADSVTAILNELVDLDNEITHSFRTSVLELGTALPHRFIVLVPKHISSADDEWLDLLDRLSDTTPYKYRIADLGIDGVQFTYTFKAQTSPIDLTEIGELGSPLSVIWDLDTDHSTYYGIVTKLSTSPSIILVEDMGRILAYRQRVSV
jgi:hypothetical protein